MTKESLKSNRKQSFKEYAYVSVILFAIYMPIRLAFVYFVADHWLGSFGVLTTVSIILVYLAQKNKLGKFGILFLKRMNKIQTGKKRFLVYGSLIFWITVWTLVSIGISQGTHQYQEKAEQIRQIVNSQEGQAQQQQIRQQMTPESTAKTVLYFFILPFTNFEAYSILITLIDEKMNSYLSHFSVIFLVESCEGLGMLIYFKIKTKNVCQTG